MENIIITPSIPAGFTGTITTEYGTTNNTNKEDKGMMNMTVKELKAMAVEMNLTFSSKIKKSELVALIEKVKEEKEETTMTTQSAVANQVTTERTYEQKLQSLINKLYSLMIFAEKKGYSNYIWIGKNSKAVEYIKANMTITDEELNKVWSVLIKEGFLAPANQQKCYNSGMLFISNEFIYKKFIRNINNIKGKGTTITEGLMLSVASHTPKNAEGKTYQQYFGYANKDIALQMFYQKNPGIKLSK